MNPFSSRRVLPALGVLAAGLALAACGSSSKTTTTTASASSTTSTNPTARRTALETCLKAHGVTLPNRRFRGARPGGAAGGAAPGGFGGGGGGFVPGGGAGGFASNPKFRAAFQACGGGNFRFRRRPGAASFSHARITAYVDCIRTHGYPQMPSPNFSGKGSVFPSSVRSNPKFASASRACVSKLIPRSGSGAAGGTGST